MGKNQEILLSIDESYIHPEWQAWGRDMVRLLADQPSGLTETKASADGNSSDNQKFQTTTPIQTLEEIFFD